MTTTETGCPQAKAVFVYQPLCTPPLLHLVSPLQSLLLYLVSLPPSHYILFHFSNFLLYLFHFNCSYCCSCLVSYNLFFHFLLHPSASISVVLRIPIFLQTSSFFLDTNYLSPTQNLFHQFPFQLASLCERHHGARGKVPRSR